MDQFLHKIEQVEKAKHELNLIKIGESFLQDYGSSSSKLVTFDVKCVIDYDTLQLKDIWKREEIVESKEPSQLSSVPQ